MFNLSLRDVELLLSERGVVVSYETVRRWCKKFGQTFANRLGRRRSRPGDKWHLDEVFIRIQGVQHYLWRAVDQDGVVLDIFVQPRQDATGPPSPPLPSFPPSPTLTVTSLPAPQACVLPLPNPALPPPPLIDCAVTPSAKWP
jgi:DDE domain